MPNVPKRIFEQLGIEDSAMMSFDSLRYFGNFPEGSKVKKGDALFPRIDVKKEAALLNGEEETPKEAKKEAKKEEKQQKKEDKKKQKEEKKELPEGTIAYDDFEKLDLRIARVLTCEKVPKSDKLLKFELSLGDETRTVLSGIAKAYDDPTVLVGRRVVLLCNLAPRKIMGIPSQGMILSGADDANGVLRLLSVDDPDALPDGSVVG